LSVRVQGPSAGGEGSDSSDSEGDPWPEDPHTMPPVDVWSVKGLE
jgi:hypothetical protein